MHESIIEIHAEQFVDKVLGADIALVDFYSTECPPCEALAAKFEPLSEIYGNDVRFVKIFRQENRELAKSLGVSGSPSLLLYHKGKQVGPILTGAIKRSDILKQLDSLVGAEKAAQLHAQIPKKQTQADVIILGGGPAGLAAGIYLAQAHLKTILIDTALPGGAVATTHMVSNYPGFIEPQNGYMLSHNMAEQAKKNGVEFRSAAEINEIDLENHRILIDGTETISAHKLIIATGSSPKPLGIPGEKEYRGHGVSYCATCDGKYYDDKDILVLGGGNSAIEESLFLSKFARSVTILHRGSMLRANKEAQDRAAREPKIKYLFNQEILEIKKHGPFEMEAIYRDKESGTVQHMNIHGVFVFVGFVPNLDGFGDQLHKDEWGYIKTDAEMRTNIPGVFSVGDVNSKHYRQITTAVADGTIAAITATKEIE